MVTAVAAGVTAAADTETMTTAATAGVAAEVAVAAAAGMAAAVEAVAPLLLITEADHEGTTAHVPDLTHHVSFFDVKIVSILNGHKIKVYMFGSLFVFVIRPLRKF